MINDTLLGENVGKLGFGAMRLPLLEDGAIDEAHVAEMVALAMENGINYFDTAYPYHGGESERVLGRVLASYPRETWLLASKYPGHQISSTGYDPAAIFEDQLKKCGVDYFDFYLLHNVYEGSMEVYLDPKWGIIDYFMEQKRRGRIKHLGFSTHAHLRCLRDFLDQYGDCMEFCQIQLNYLDWTLQEGKQKYGLLTERNIPIVVMEPLRGGRLAALSDEATSQLRNLRTSETPAAWSFRFLQDLPNVKVVLSGMSNIDQMRENLATFEQTSPLSAEETTVLLEVAESMKDSVPCTGCGYCLSSCPQRIDIPLMLDAYNNLKVEKSFTVAMGVECVDDARKPYVCLRCNACVHMCPQRIDIPAKLAELNGMLMGIPKWADMCREREEAARKGP